MQPPSSRLPFGDSRVAWLVIVWTLAQRFPAKEYFPKAWHALQVSTQPSAARQCQLCHNKLQHGRSAPAFRSMYSNEEPSGHQKVEELC